MAPKLLNLFKFLVYDLVENTSNQRRARRSRGKLDPWDKKMDGKIQSCSIITTGERGGVRFQQLQPPYNRPSTAKYTALNIYWYNTGILEQS